MKIFWLIAGGALFALLMGLRQSAETGWARAVIAGVAGAILALTIGLYKRKPS